MIKLVKLGVLLFSCLSIEAQDFHGYILYKNVYLDSVGRDITEDIGGTMGTEQHYFIQDGDYVGINENGALVQLYNVKTNTYYLQMGGEVKSIPADTEFPKELNLEDSDERINVLDYECKSVILITEMGRTTYYFSAKISVNPIDFSGHRFGNWSQYLIRSRGAIPLKVITEMNGFTHMMEAEKIMEGNVDKAKFDVNNYLRKD